MKNKPSTGIFDVANDAKGGKAESIRGAIRWNAVREKYARSNGKTADADRYAANQASGVMQLIKIAQAQAA